MSFEDSDKFKNGSNAKIIKKLQNLGLKIHFQTDSWEDYNCYDTGYPKYFSRTSAFIIMSELENYVKS